MRKSTYVLVITFIFLWTTEASAVLITQNFYSENLHVHGEYSNGVAISAELQEFAPLFSSPQPFSGSISYDTEQPDIDPSSYGTYRIGNISLNLPEMGISVSQSSSNMQISAFDNTPNPDDQFFANISAYPSGMDNFSNNVGLPNPVELSVSLFGNTSMLDNDLLPQNQLDAHFGNLSFTFLGSDNTYRQILTTFVPEPAPTPEPRTFGLFVGANSILGYVGVTSGDGGKTAEMVRKSFVALDNFSAEDAHLLSEFSISDSKIKEEIDKIRLEMHSGDRFVLYMDFHGSSFLEGDESADIGLDGDEFLVTGALGLGGPNVKYPELGFGFDNYQLTDDELYSYLKVFGDDIQKWVFVSSCYSGGFWDSSNPADEGDLSKLNNIGFASASAENEESKYFKEQPSNIDDDVVGLSLWGYALSETLDSLIDSGSLTFENLTKDAGDFYNTRSPFSGIVKDNEINDVEYLFTLDMYKPFSANSSDFDPNINLSPAPVPEPATFILLGSGLAGLAFYRRKRK